MKDKRKKDGYDYCCIECRREREKKNYLERRKYIKEYKLSKGCSICGYNKCAAALEFHHNGNKGFRIGIANRGLKTIKKEIEKCELLCSNCHRELHEKIEGDYTAKKNKYE